MAFFIIAAVITSNLTTRNPVDILKEHLLKSLQNIIDIQICLMDEFIASCFDCIDLIKMHTSAVAVNMSVHYSAKECNRKLVSSPLIKELS
jgi:hypothetical protein